MIKTFNAKTQKELTPEVAIQLLKEGKARFVNNLKANRDLLQQVNETSESQHPFAFILSCIDSRTSAELIFDQGLGDIFSCRIAGSVLNEYILGSMEFACKVAGAKLIMVLGHTECGAIKGACDNVKMGHLTSLLSKITPAVDSDKTVKENRDSGNSEFVDKVATLNVQAALSKINKISPIIDEMHKKGEIAIIGGMYDVSTGVVTFY